MFSSGFGRPPYACSSHMLVERITFEEILPIWRDHLWAGSTIKIETHSAIVFRSNPFEYDIRYFDEPASYFAAVEDGRILGVNSGHATFGVYRTRGMYVFPEFRGRGVGSQLLLATFKQGVQEGKSSCWGMPRKSAWEFYAQHGFEQVSECFHTETSDQNCYARAGFRELGLIP